MTSPKAPHLSIVSPVYLAEVLVSPLVERIVESVETITSDFEIILVDDGSPDASWQAIEVMASRDSRVKGVRLSRNFGQHYAITAGLTEATGAWVVVMDCDLQDRPEEIPNLYREAISSHYDLVFARRSIRQDSWARRVASTLFYKTFSFLTDTEQDASVANFGIYRKNVVEAVLSMGDSVRFFPTMSQWVGFQRGYLDVQHAARESGVSTYNFRRLFRLATENIVAFSNKPLKLTITLGSSISVISFLIALYFLIKYLSGGIVVLGFTSLILSIWFIGGMIIALLGMVGLYVGYTFERVKQRPVYIVSERRNFREP